MMCTFMMNFTIDILLMSYKACCSNQGRSIMKSLALLVETLFSSLIRLIVSDSLHFVTRSSQHADHPSDTKPLVATTKLHEETISL